MKEMYFITVAVLIVNIYTHYQVLKDNTYLLDEEKPSLLRILWFIPIIGIGIAQYRLHADKTFYITVMGLFFLLRYAVYALLYMFI